MVMDQILHPDTEQPPISDATESRTEPEKVFRLKVFNTKGRTSRNC